MSGGGWSEEAVGGHPCDVYEPGERNGYGYVVIYLHGVHLNRLVDKTPFVEQFERWGLPVVAPMTRRSWWTDRICDEFDPQLTADSKPMRVSSKMFTSRRPRRSSQGAVRARRSENGHQAVRESHQQHDLEQVRQAHREDHGQSGQ